MTALQYLESQKLNISSPAMIVKTIREKRWSNIEIFQTLIHNVAPDLTDHTFGDFHLARITFLYLAHDIVVAGFYVEGMGKAAIKKAEQFLNNNQWARASPTYINKANTTTPQQFGSKLNRGVKQEQAYLLYKKNRKTMTRKQLIEMFVEKVGLTQLAAQTYYYNFKKILPNPAQPPVDKKQKKIAPGQSKYERALAMFKENPTVTKHDFIERAIRTLKTTRAGAYTYYYVAKKSVNTTHHL